MNSSGNPLKVTKLNNTPALSMDNHFSIINWFYSIPPLAKMRFNSLNGAAPPWNVAFLSNPSHNSLSYIF